MAHLFTDVRARAVALVAAALAVVAAGLALAGRGPAAYHEPFDAPGSWGQYNAFSPEGSGTVADGVYNLQVTLPRQRAWATAERWFQGDARYSVEVTQVEGPLTNAHGLIWHVDEPGEGFYFFLITPDGLFSAGYCVNECLGAERNMTRGWQPSDAIHAAGETNTLAVRAEGNRYTFFINDEQVWEATESKFTEGDIGLMLETYSEGGAWVQFDNFRVEPLG